MTRIGKVWTTFLPEKSFSPAAVSLNQLDSTLTSIMREKALPDRIENTKSLILKLSSSSFSKYDLSLLGFLPYQNLVECLKIVEFIPSCNCRICSEFAVKVHFLPSCFTNLLKQSKSLTHIYVDNLSNTLSE